MDFDDAIASHAAWKVRLRVAISDEATLDTASIRRDDCCAFGTWLRQDGRAKYGDLQDHADCIAHHRDFHHESADIAEAINRREYAQAKEMLSPRAEYARISHRLGLAILHLRRKAAAMDR